MLIWLNIFEPEQFASARQNFNQATVEAKSARQAQKDYTIIAH